MSEVGDNVLSERAFHEHLAAISRAEVELEIARKRKNGARKQARAAWIKGYREGRAVYDAVPEPGSDDDAD